MNQLRKRELGLLLLGDILFFAASLYLALLFRLGEHPSEYILNLHFIPFSFLFLVSLLVFFISGLYDNHTTLFKNRLPQTVVRAQTLNAIIAALFFFMIPAFGITPKTTLVLYLIVSSILIIVWRLALFNRLFTPKKERALLIGETEEVEELLHEVNQNSRYEFEFVHTITPKNKREGTVPSPDALKAYIADKGITVIVGDTSDTLVTPFLPLFFALTVRGTLTFVPFSKMYESIFERIPLSALRYDWFLDQIGNTSRPLYYAAKRALDIVGALCAGLVFLILLPFVALLVRIEGKGPLFILQERMGPRGKLIRVYKIRTMTANDSGAWIGHTENKVTKVGALLRKTSIDELPQIWNILKGEMSLIGPRNDIIGLARKADEEIPYYMVRYRTTPGITGWAQTHQQYAPGEINPQSIEAFRTRLAYDLYYVKHRSFILDINIALRTVKTLLSRFGVQLKVR